MESNGTVKAGNLMEGDFLTGLDNGYVFEEPDFDDDVRNGDYNTRRGGEGYVTVNFHTAEGDEGYLTVPKDMPVAVHRPSGDFDYVAEEMQDDEDEEF